jgi:hypothetical protein
MKDFENVTQGERLARIETLLEALPAIRIELKEIRDEARRDTEDLAALKNKGAGLLIGVGLIGGFVGAFVKAWLSHLFN